MATLKVSALVADWTSWSNKVARVQILSWQLARFVRVFKCWIQSSPAELTRKHGTLIFMWIITCITLQTPISIWSIKPSNICSKWYWIVLWIVLWKLLGSRLSWIRVLLLQLVGKWLSTGDVEVDTDWAFHGATNQFDKLSYSPIEVSVRSYFCGVAKRLRRLRPVGQILARNLSRRHLPTFSTFFVAFPFAFPTAGNYRSP